MSNRHYNEDRTQKTRRAQTNVRRERKRGSKVVGDAAIKSAKAEARSRRKYKEGYKGTHPGHMATGLVKAAWDRLNVEANKRIKRAKVKRSD